MNPVHFMSEKNDWETPQELFNELHAEFRFTLDAAASDQNHKLPRYYTEETDGLSKDWGGERVFCNPPYGDKETGVWTEKCWREAQKPNTLVVLLIPARTDRKSFHDFIYNKPNVEIRFLKGRLRFEDNGQKLGTAPFPSMLVIFNKEEPTMATKTPEKTPTVDVTQMNVWAKLLAVRTEFYAEGAKKTGKNLHAEFKYFELEDIVPVAAPIFDKYGLLFMPTFVDGNAVAKIINIDNPEQFIDFTIPLQFIAEPAKFRMNEVQGVGAVVTYYRRYLYMVVLDLVESDGFDGQKPKVPDDSETPAPVAAPKKNKPVSAAERETIKTELTDADGNADELQIDGLKAALKKLMELDPDQENFVQEIAVKTESFTKITKANCEALINGVKEMIAAYGSDE